MCACVSGMYRILAEAVSRIGSSGDRGGASGRSAAAHGIVDRAGIQLYQVRILPEVVSVVGICCLR
jgi:hypothetical protein